MIITKKALPRRTFLRGMGVTMALPLLDAMIPAQTAWAATAANPVRRLGFVYVPMGSNINAWTPGGAGFGVPVKAGVDQLTELSPTLRSLTPVMDQVTVLTNIVGIAGGMASGE